MKKSIQFFVFVLALSFIGQKIHAQDICSTNPKYCKVLNDTAGLKMMEITLPPGAKLVSHTHPVNFGYCLQGGLYKWTYQASGKTESYQMKPGDHFQGGPEDAHISWNAGKTTIKFLLIEKQ